MSLIVLISILSIGSVVGLVMGLTGAGGGILAIPLLVYQGWSMQQAMPVALFAVTAGALIGTVEGMQKKLVRYRAASLMALCGAPMAIIGVRIASGLPQAWLMAGFAMILMLVFVRLVYQLRQIHDPATTVMATINQASGRFDWSARAAGIIGLIGSLSGLVTGMLGVGGGFVIVPMLRHFTNISMHGAVATSLMVIALVGSITVGAAVVHGAVLPPLLTVLFTVATIMGTLAGRRISRFLPARVVQMLFASLLLMLALSFLWKAVHF